ncbi:hypothetical protein [Hydromonas duriensis]|uniref:Uncharacterized protein n=1 Tax=Hydromonas duriensis TaxID=1527608 RepID=A0A4R6Y6Y5_9BURK|nr:hypothetical protein [Hydromonas duriensis]TDR30227.1 hypothetical protein DFR44_1243 [Hydromonas duriensis]
MSVNNETDGVLSRTESFVMMFFFDDYPQDMTFDAMMNAYEDPNNKVIVATEFWSMSLYREDLVDWVRGMEASMRFEFFPAQA